MSATTERGSEPQARLQLDDFLKEVLDRLLDEADLVRDFLSVLRVGSPCGKGFEGLQSVGQLFQEGRGFPVLAGGSVAAVERFVNAVHELDSFGDVAG